MQVDIPLEIDLGPLAWVKDEVTQTLSRARAQVEAMITRSAPAEAAKNAHDEVHQASGAFELIGIEGLAIFTREIERHLKTLVDSPDAPNAGEVLTAVERALRRLTSHLEEVFSGAPCKPMVLTREYAALHRLRGSEAGASDLFFPDLNRKPPKLEGVEPVAGDRIQSYLLGARRGYEKGLLVWLRGDKAGLVAMRDQVNIVERAFPLPAQRSFWWSVSGMFDAVRSGSLGETIGVKQLAARVDLQLRRFVEGSTKVSERLRREVLFHIGRAESPEGRPAEVQRLYDLPLLMPAPGAIRNSIDYVALQPTIKALAEKINEIRAGWQRAVSGQFESRDTLRRDCSAASKLSDALQRPNLSNLFVTLAEVVPAANIDLIPDRLAVEFSSALLFSDTALTNFAGNASAYEAEAASLSDELQIAAHGLAEDGKKRSIPTITRRAQERESFRTLLFEVRENLSAIESALDTWVRGSGLLQPAPLHTKIAQTIGVFSLSDQLEAANHLRAIDADLAKLVPDADPANQGEVVSAIAEKLSVLGFYVDAKEKQPDADATHLLKPIAAESREIEPSLLGGVQQASEAGSNLSVESDVERQRKALAHLLARIKNEPGSASLKEEISSRLNQLLQDAKLLGNAELVGQIRQAMVALEQAPVETVSSDVIALASTVAYVPTAPLPEISTQTQKLLAKDEVEQDEALTEIYLEEATEIMGSLKEYLQILSASPNDQETLISTRRSFHTLKGSGRMVGFNELGDCAWEIERHLNDRIAHESPLTPADRHLLAVAHQEFEKWIAAIKVDVRASRRLDRKTLDQALRAATGRDPEPPKPYKPPVALSQGVATVAPVKPVSNDNTLDSLFSFAPASAGAAAASVAVGATFIAPLVGTAAPESRTLSFAPENADADQLAAAAILDDFFLEAAIDDALDAQVQSASVPAPAVSIEQALSPGHIETIDVQPAAALVPAEVTPVGLPAQLHAIMTEEAAGHLAVLTQEIERMNDDPAMGPSESMIRAAHTLKGMHRAVGLDDIGSLAGELEAALIAVKNDPPADQFLPALATAVAALQIQFQCLRERLTPDEADAEMVNIARDSLASINLTRTARSADDDLYSNEVVLSDLKAVDTPPADFEFAAPPSLPTGFAPHLAPDASASDDVAFAEELEHVVEIAEAKQPEFVAEPAQPAALFNHSASQPSVSTGAAIGLGLGATGAALAASVTTHQTASVVSPMVESAPPSAVPSIPSAPAIAQVSAQAPAATPHLAMTHRAKDVLAGIRDDLETTVLPIFLEEAQELFPQASAQVRQWRENPSDDSQKNGLKRTMHTIKGSARMAGAMRLGELAHQFETRLEEDHGRLVVSTQLFDELDFDLDCIAFLLDRLERGEADTPLPGTESAAPVKEVAIAALEVEPVQPAPESLPVVQPPVVESVAANIVATPSEVPAAAFVAAATVPTIVAQMSAPVASALSSQAASTFTPAQPTFDPNQIVQNLLETDQAAQQQVLRVRADAVERLADETGEMSISRSRAETELKSLRANLNELTSSVVRLRTQVREIEIQAETQIQSRLTQVQDESSDFDPLEFDRFTRFQELTRSLAEGVNDVQTVQQSFVASLDAADSALNSQSRIARSLQSQLQSIRTIPFVSLRERLYRTLRQTARDLNKRANMDIRGGDLSIDRSVLEKLAPLVEHVLRNALAHGIELPADRVAAGKSETGEIMIELRQQGNLVELSITDDGRGFNVPAIRAKAIAQGLATPADAFTNQQWVEFVFRSGFTTASEVSAVAGRGVGMDVVRTEIGALGGRVEARPDHVGGAKFVLFVPLTLTLLNVVMVKIGVNRYGFPAAMVEAVKSVKRADFELARAYGMLAHGREKITLASLHPYLGESPQLRDDAGDQVLVIRSGNRVLAVDVDAVQGNQEVVLKRMGPQLARVQGLVGVTLLGDGDIVLLFDPISLVSGAIESTVTETNVPAPVQTQIVQTTTAAEPQETAVAAATPIATLAPVKPRVEPTQEVAAKSEQPEVTALAPFTPTVVAKPTLTVVPPTTGTVVPFRTLTKDEKPLVLVVDDSLTVRKITTRFLEREGFRALSAKDGMDALSVLADHKPSVILLDIEMPRMDGFEFARAAKGDDELKNIPIIMITSRTAEKHRNHAMELGVNVYLGKPYQDDELLKHIKTFTAK